MSTKVTHPQERSKIDKFIATLKQLSLYHWIAAILAMYGLLSILGSYNPWLAANLPGWLIGKGVGPLIVAIAVAFYAYAEVNTPDDDPPVRQSEFIAEVSQLSSKIEDKQRTIDDLKRKIDKTRGELRNTPTKLPDRDLFVTTPPLNGDDVYLLQSKLIKLGYSLPDQITGEYDNATEIAVRRFQRAKSLIEDGITGPNTKRAIDKELEKP